MSRLHGPNQGDLRLSHLHQREHRGGRNGTGLAWRVSVKVRNILNGGLDKGDYTLVLQSMLLVDENHAGASTSTHAGGKML